MRIPKPSTEDEVHRLLAEGDRREAGTIALIEYGPKILGFLAKTLNDLEAAKEAFSEFHYRFWVSLAKYEPRPNRGILSWMYGLARNARKRRWRSQNRDLRFDHDQEALIERTTQHLSKQLEAAEQRVVLQQLRALLDDDEREVLTLYYDNELSGPEVAEILGISRAAVRQRLSRTREKLRELAADKGNIEGIWRAKNR